MKPINTIKHENGCLSLNGDLSRYSRATLWGESVPAHRAVYQLVHDVDIGELYVHHICGNKGCVNPEHLALVTRHNHGTAHAMHRRRCEFAEAQGTESPQWISVVEDLTKTVCEEDNDS